MRKSDPRIRCDRCARARAGGPASRRSFVMLAVLVCMLSAMLVATSLLFVSQSEAAGAAGSADSAQARSLLWSGMQALASRLAEQRERILAGEAPLLDEQFVVYETDSRAGVVRLLPVNADGALIALESAKLDVNHITAEALALTGMMDRSAADALIAWRDGLGRPVQSIAELLGAPGVTIQTLYGEMEGLLAADVAGAAADSRRDTNSGAARGLADVLTVFAVEPAVQFTGQRRINLNQPWSDELGRRIEERFGAEVAGVLKQVFESGTKFESDAGLVKAMRAYGTAIDDWPAVLDAFTTDRGEFHFARLNINAAGREALMALPGMTEEQAAKIIAVREELSAIERGSIAWLVSNQIFTPEAFEPIASRITARSWTFRVRLAAGEVDVENLDGPLSNPMVQEAVIDLCGPKPRLAYLRDVSLLRDAALIAMDASTRAEESPDELADPWPATSPEQPSRIGPNAPATRPGRAPLPGRSSLERDGEDDPPEAAADAPAESGPRRIGRWTSGG